MHRGSRRPWRRGKGGFKCRPHSRLRILSLLEKMKKAYGRMMASLVSLGESAFGFNSFTRSKRRSYVYPSAPVRRPCYGESNSFYAEAIADCIEFIKLSSSRQDGVR